MLIYIDSSKLHRRAIRTSAKTRRVSQNILSLNGNSANLISNQQSMDVLNTDKCENSKILV